ncbi:MAG: hypothetical protein OXG60_09920 [Chloroflexi bacterium]|nr:hypothetical protein [Chloroflexota bacterium]
MVMLLLVPLALGQDGNSVIEPYDEMMVNPDVNISFPPPVYVVRDSIDIRGTVNLPSILSYFVEFRPLLVDMMDSEDQAEGQWFPATVPQRSSVVDDILGTWNTLTARDGLYELRLNINTGDGPEYVRLSPIRVENNPPSFVEDSMQTEVEEPPDPTVEPEPVEEPLDDSPRVVAQVNSNVRAGDNTFYQVVGFLLEGKSAKILGTSSRGTSWYFIELANGVRGFIHPNIVRAEGDLSNLERIAPPPLPPTPIPIPTAIPVEAPPAAPAAPASGPNLVFGEIRMEPHPATCNETYTIHVTVQNNGNGDAGGFSVEVRDSRMGTGAGQATTQIGYPPVPAGQSRSAFGRITQNQHYEEVHHVNLFLDIHNQVSETNEGDNHGATAAYILRRGRC